MRSLRLSPLSITLLLILTLMLAGLAFSSHTHKASPSHPIKKDAYAHQLTYRTYDKNGNVNSIIQAARSSYEQSSQLITFTQPTITAFTPNAPPWTISADQGNSDKNYQKIQLSGHVTFQQPSPKNSQTPPTTISTDQALIDIKKKQVTSSSHVVIQHGTSRIEGDGLKADLKTGQYSLLSNTQGLYTPTATPKKSSP